MLTFALLQVALLAAPAADVDRDPVVVFVLSPKGVAAGVTSRIVAGLDDSLKRWTSLHAVPAERVGVSLPELRACPAATRIACWVERVTASAKSPGRGYILAVGVLPVDGRQARVSAILVDLGSSRGVEQSVVHVAGSTVDLVARLRAHLEGLVRDRLRGAFERTGHWRPSGTLVVRADLAGATIELDDRVVGVTGSAPLTLEHVPAGTHQLAVRRDGAEVVPYEVAVSVGAVTELEVEVPRVLNPVRRGLFWSGVAVALAGVVIVAASPAAADSNPAVCVLRDGADPDACPTAGGPSTGRFDGGYPAAGAEGYHRQGVPLIPLGVSLALAGATWTTAAELWGDVEDAPWWGVLLGAAVGGAAYGIGHALDRVGGPQ